MTQPQTFEEHLRENYFIADHKLVVTMAVDNFDAVWRVDQKTGQVDAQFMIDLPETKGDCKVIRQAVKKYGVLYDK